MLTGEQKQTVMKQFSEDGYTILRGVLEDQVVKDAQEAVNILVDRIAERLVQEGAVEHMFSELPLETRLYRLCEHHLDKVPPTFRAELHLEGLYGLFFHPVLLDVAELFLGGEVRLYPNYSLRPKLPDFEAARVLWHQDGGYTASINREGEVDSMRMVNVWSPLVPATVENGCMQFIPGTHKLGVVPHEEKAYYLEIADSYLAPRLKDAVDIELLPGDVVFFHNLLFHQGQPNRSRHIRWSLDWRYQDATQSTLREQAGHIARSKANPRSAVHSKAQWAELTFR